ncbi:MAG TPA: hypothetical protein VH115_07015 [Solirubrobacteraceae bacterium]|nr:hypothetical protein [Solirubrobacteraceae bacterium]
MKGIHRHSTGTRDAALRRLTSANRWLIAGSIALTGILSEVAAQAFPGKKLGSAGAAGARTSTTTRHAPSASSEGFHPPEQAPQASGESQGAPESQAPQSGSGSSESPPRSGESAPPSSESSPPSSEATPPAETRAQPAPESSAESPPVVSGGS